MEKDWHHKIKQKSLITIVNVFIFSNEECVDLQNAFFFSSPHCIECIVLIPCFSMLLYISNIFPRH